MLDPQELRRRAAQLRRAASVRTVGGQAADRRLVELALRLEQLAEAIERFNRVEDDPDPA